MGGGGGGNVCFEASSSSCNPLISVCLLSFAWSILVTYFFFFFFFFVVGLICFICVHHIVSSPTFGMRIDFLCCLLISESACVSYFLDMTLLSRDHQLLCQSLEFGVETRILAEMKIENCGNKYFFVGKNGQAYFFTMKIKMIDL